MLFLRSGNVVVSRVIDIAFGFNLPDSYDGGGARCESNEREDTTTLYM